MEDRPILEKLAWIAGILGFVYMVAAPSKPADPPAPVSAPAPAPAASLATDVLTVGSCNLDVATTDGLKINGLYDEVLHLCSTGKASTVGQGFRIPSIHADTRFQYFNPGEFNNDHGLSDGRMTMKVVYQTVSVQLSRCFSSSFDEGASPHERIDLEIDCLQRNGLKAQDKVYLMMVENARAEGRSAIG